MDQIFGKRLKELRISRGLSQREFAEKLSISFQSVSKWETGNSYPNISLIPSIASILKVSCDHLIGHEDKEIQSKYFELYKNKDYFWTTEPNALSYKLLQMFPPAKYRTVLELGCGEGRDAVFFGMNRYDVTAIDNVSTGIEKGIQLAAANQIQADFLCADIRSFTSKTEYDMIYGFRVLHYIPPRERLALIQRYQEMTRSMGVHIFTVCVEKSFVPLPPDHEPETYLFKSGELFEYYSNWKLLYINEDIVDCNSSGIPHQHVIDTVIAQKFEEPA